ncbi:hypothetical protein A9Q84_17685 [Halobacteriovorax marinus]|uniref:Uncharacterized protein n=1 Tax=Halobacteriovorax marinus TaxID=97084 RepID=A0A1Y5F3J2_9BACT|nr:hypothetical protein A9Q84_17685 [Halobacteriovorax marinus]
MKAICKIIILFLLFQNAWANEFAAQREQCSKDSSRTWSTRLNRCMTTKEFNESLANYKNCTSKTTKEKRDTCMRDLVLAVSGDVSLDSFEWDDVAMTTVSSIMTFSNMQFKSDSVYATCTSLKIAGGCGVASILKTVYVSMLAKKETESNEKDFREKVASKDDYETQIIAYQSQVDQLNSLSKYYYMKSKLNKFVAACYGAAAIAAAYEMTMGNNTCLMTESQQTEHTKEVDAAKKLDPSATVDGPSGLFGKFVGGGTGVDATAGANKFTRFMKTPVGVASLSVINMGWNIYKAGKMDEQGEKSKLLALRADIAKNQFITGMTKYCPKGHEDKSDAVCYCYDGGKKMENRSNSKVCQDLWSTRNRNLFANSSDKTRKDPNRVRMGCVSQAGGFDANCECRKFKDQDGNNACRKSSFSKIQLGGLANSLNFKQLENSLNDIQSGIDNTGNFDFTKNFSTAIQDKIRKQTISKMKVADKSGNPRAATEKDLLSLESKLTKDLQASGALKLAANANKSLAAISQKSLAAIQSKSSKSSSLQMVGGKGQSAIKKKKKAYAFNLDMGSQGTVQKFDEGYMKKTYNMNDADVVKNKDVSIFKVLSNRYSKSGYKRLFEDTE